jgi:hypothetical protein
MSKKEDSYDEVFDEINEEKRDNSEDKRSKNARQYKARLALEDRLEEKRLNKLLGFEEYAFDDGDEL